MGVTALLTLTVLTAPIISEVELRLPAGTDKQVVKDAPSWISVAKGQPLSIKAVRRTIERLMNTGRFSDIEVRGDEHDGRISLIIEAYDIQRIRDLFVDKSSNGMTAKEVVTASKLEPGFEYTPEGLAAAEEEIRQAYRRRGYWQTKVTSSVSMASDGVDVVIQIEEGEPTRISSISFGAEGGLPYARLIETLDLKIGDVAEHELIEQGAVKLKELLRKERFFRARVDPFQLDATGRLVVAIHSGPQYRMEFRGNRRYPVAMLKAVNGYAGAEALDASLMARMGERLETFYRYRGFHDVRVRVREVTELDGRHAVLLTEIDEGLPYWVRRVEFEGNSAVSGKELRELLTEMLSRSRPASAEVSATFDDPLQMEGRQRSVPLFDVPEPDLRYVWVEAAYVEAASAMRALYRDRGFLGAQVALASATFERHGVQVRFNVSEGPRVTVRKVSHVGAPPQFFPEESLNSEWLLAPLSPRRVEAQAQRLATELSRLGYLYAKVDGEWTVEREQEGYLVFRMTPGPQVHVGNVLVRGLQRTDDKVVRQQLLFREGQVLNPEQLVDSQRNLLGLGIFRTAEVKLKDPEVQDTVKDVVVEAIEAARLQFEPYFGYYLAEGVRGGLDLQLPNLFGKAVGASADLRAYYFGASAPATTGRVDVSNIPQYLLFGGRGNISVSKRLAFGSNWDVGLRANTFFERVFRQSYQFNRFAAVPGFDVTVQLPTRPGWPRLKIALLTQYEFDVANVREVKSGEPLQLLRVDQERLRFSYGTFGLSTVRFAPTLDFRDDAGRPRCCVVVSFPIEYTTANFAVDQFGQKVPVEFIKISGSITGYVSIAKGVVLALSARAGNIFPLRQNSITPPVKRFFVGGATSLRGFPEDSLLPEDVRATYRANVRECESLANPLGCTDDAASLRAGRYVPSPGGEVFAITKVELRFPFVGDFNLGVFGEAGNLWLDATRVNASLRPVAGVGLRYQSPIGPLALDVGFNLLPDLVVNEPIFNIHFNVGVF